MGHGFNFHERVQQLHGKTGIDYDNSYVIRASDATDVITVNQNGNTTMSGNLDVGKVLTLKRVPGVSDTTPLVIINDSPGGATVATYTSTASNQGCVFLHTTAASSTPWMTGVVWGGLNEFVIWNGCNNIGLAIKPTGDVSISGNLDVGTTGNNSIKTHGTGVATSDAKCKINNGYNSYWGFQNGNHSQAWSNIPIKGSSFMSFSHHDNIIHTRTFANWSGDRLKENDIFIESACETLSKLRPQLYHKKPNMENNDSTTWIKEGGLIAQGIYYDAPELEHLINRTNNEIDEESNIIPLPEIPTSIDPQQDPDYSSWGKDPASINYIGLIAYLVKANTELHERAKALESK